MVLGLELGLIVVAFSADWCVDISSSNQLCAGPNFFATNCKSSLTMTAFADCMKLFDLFSLWDQITDIAETFPVSITIEARKDHNFAIFSNHFNPFDSLFICK